jgi:two-component system phosphate regulon sensor histidine kinase PhoR
MANELQSALIAAIPYPAFILDQELNICCANTAALQLFEMDLAGLHIVRVLRQPEAINCVQAAIKSGSIETENLVLNLHTPRTYQISASPYSQEEPENKNILFTLLDVSAEIDAENSRSTFVANVSHELRSPLTSLMGVVETLQGPARDDENARDRFLQLMHDETQRMSRLVGDLLSLSKLEAKEHLPPSGHVDLMDVIKGVQNSLEAIEKGNAGRIELSVEGNLPSIRGDRDELIEVFQNLLENALKYSTPKTPIQLTIHHREAENSDKPGHLIVKIMDQGEGIAQEHLPRLTERFYRVDKGRSREMGGTGLGLAITKHILNRHRGKLTVESVPGSGTHVTVILRV